MFRLAYKYDDAVVFYFDSAGNKYVASSGTLAWRINNPGLVRCHSHFSRPYGAIGNYDCYAIFSNPTEGRKALSAWLHSKKYYGSTLKAIAEQYQPDAIDTFLNRLSALSKISTVVKLRSLSQLEFERLLFAIEKLCGYTTTGNELFSLLPKITAKIENGENKEDTYLTEGNVVLSKSEAIDRILTHRLDGVIVQECSGGVHLRSRPHHSIWNIKTHDTVIAPTEGKIDALVRVVGEKKPGQCVWAFINGIDNTKEDALESTERISKATGGEAVLSMPNDTICKVYDLLTCIVLKTSIDTPMIAWTVKFLRYLLHNARQEVDPPPVIVFAHSQGATYLEHALELLSSFEKNNLRIFTFGGGSFISPGTCHPDSHNYASAADFVCKLGSPNHQLLALERYFGRKSGFSDKEIVAKLAYSDAVLHLDSPDPHLMGNFIKQRTTYYENEFLAIRNLTILDPDPDSKWKHTFKSDCYQTTVQALVKKYQKS